MEQRGNIYFQYPLARYITKRNFGFFLYQKVWYNLAIDGFDMNRSFTSVYE